MNILSEEFENGIRSVVRIQFKESFTEFLDQETSEKRWLSLESGSRWD